MWAAGKRRQGCGLRLRSAAGRRGARQPRQRARRVSAAGSAAGSAIFRARGSVFAQRQLLCGFPGAPAPLRDPSYACWGSIAPFGTTNGAVTQPPSGLAQFGPLYHTPTTASARGGQITKAWFAGSQGNTAKSVHAGSEGVRGGTEGCTASRAGRTTKYHIQGHEGRGLRSTHQPDAERRRDRPLCLLTR
jgi:hypothetical protein